MATTEHAPFYYMALDVLQGVLARAQRLEDVSESVVATMRELTGARGVCLHAGPGDLAGENRILAISPRRKREAFRPGQCAALLRAWRAAGEPELLTLAMVFDAGTHEAFAALAHHSLVVLPLSMGETETGALFLFDPPERAEHLADVFAFIKPLQTLLGLVLSQSLLVERQEITIGDRTRELVRTGSFYRTLFASSPFPIALADPATGLFQDVNAAFEELVGRPRGEIVGQHHSCIHPAEALRTADGAILGFAEASANPGGPALSDVVVRSDGTRREVEIRVRLLPAVSPPTLLGFFDDVTERNRLTREEQRLQDELFQSQKLEALGALAGGIAHDFNNLLSGIRGYSELALHDLSDPAAAREDLEFVLKAADRARDLVRQILAFSRRSMNERVPVDVAAVVVEALSLVRGSIPGNVVCEVAVDKDTGKVLGQGTSLHQITMNLCTNAVQAMAEKGGTLFVSVEPVRLVDDPHLPSGRFARLVVRDTGAGMAESVRSRIFEPYFTTKPMGQGTGLGLSVARGIVESLRGAIRVESTPGEGTTFAVLLPLCPE